MKWIIILAIWQGQLGFQEVHDYETKAECEAAFYHLIDLYMRDGVSLDHLNGGCYPKVSGQ